VAGNTHRAQVPRSRSYRDHRSLYREGRPERISIKRPREIYGIVHDRSRPCRYPATPPRIKIEEARTVRIHVNNGFENLESPAHDSFVGPSRRCCILRLKKNGKRKGSATVLREEQLSLVSDKFIFRCLRASRRSAFDVPRFRSGCDLGNYEADKSYVNAIT